MAPGLVGKAKAARGKTPTDVWVAHYCQPPTGVKRPAIRHKSRSEFSIVLSRYIHHLMIHF